MLKIFPQKVEDDAEHALHSRLCDLTDLFCTLEDTHVRILLALRNGGEQTTAALGEHTGIRKTTTQSALVSLAARSMVTWRQKGKITHYQLSPGFRRVLEPLLLWYKQQRQEHGV